MRRLFRLAKCLVRQRIGGAAGQDLVHCATGVAHMRRGLDLKTLTQPAGQKK